MVPQVKICGLTRAQDVEAAIAAGADYLGFIVETPSKRRLSAQDAARISRPAIGIIPRVAVTVNLNNDILQSIVNQMAPDFIQCHGDESPSRVAEIGRRFNVNTIKAISVATQDDIQRAAHYENACDLLLYDAKAPKDMPRGGHGLPFDWMLLAYANKPHKFALAGGLTPENVSEALRRTNAPILDVSSGVEAAPGVKDALKIHSLIKAAHNG